MREAGVSWRFVCWGLDQSGWILALVVLKLMQDSGKAFACT